MYRWSRHQPVVIALSLSVGMAATPLRAATVVLDAAHDATVFQNNSDNGSGAGNGLFAGTNGANSPRRALIAFDLPTIPAGAVVQSAQLTLYLGQVAGSGGGVPGGGTETSTISLHRITSSWGEGMTQRRDPPTDTLAGVGQGAPAEDDDATWNERFFAAEPPLPWNTPGGDFVHAESTSLVVDRTVNAPFTWPSTANVVVDVQGWLANPAANFGWILVNEDETAPTTFRAFYSRDVATAAYHPKLTITFVETAATADFDQDGDVDGADFLTWQENLGTTSGAAHGDGDADVDGAVTALDLAAWKQQFGAAQAPAAVVPEPHGAALLITALSLALAAQGRNKWQ